jgi:hypothetical protein
LSFETVPFGNDIFAQFGDEFALPVLGNFDPPISGKIDWTNPLHHLDVNRDTFVSPLDALLVINRLGQGLPNLAEEAEPMYYDVNGDSGLSPLDALLVINDLNGPTEVARAPLSAGAVPSDADSVDSNMSQSGSTTVSDLVDVVVEAQVSPQLAAVRPLSLPGGLTSSREEREKDEPPGEIFADFVQDVAAAWRVSS